MGNRALQRRDAMTAVVKPLWSSFRGEAPWWMRLASAGWRTGKQSREPIARKTPQCKHVGTA
jgi:hypothetical protein